MPRCPPFPARPWSVAAAVVVCAAGAGCLPPSQACEDFVACQRAYDETVDVSAYESGGSCWTTPQQAAACDAVCERSLRALRDTPDPPDACDDVP